MEAEDRIYLVHEIRGEWHRKSCDGTCGSIMGCAPQWQPVEINRMQNKAPHMDPYLLDQLQEAVRAELNLASIWPPMNSAHEGYGVLLEEVDELWAWVKTKQRDRDLDKMKKEALQVAAMAIRFAHDICNEQRGRK